LGTDALLVQTVPMENRHVPPMEDEYAHDRGLGLVSIPCLRNAKAAAVSWKPLQDREPTAAELSQYVAMFRAGYNRALLCGARSDIVVIDLDDVPRGLAVLRERGVPLSPAQCRTWSQKLHLYYRHPGVRVPPMVKVLGEPIDVRGDGSYAVAPGSSIDGKLYERTGVWDRRLMPVYKPEWFPANEPPKQPRIHLVSTKVESVRRYIMKIVAVSGSRGHAATFRAACKAADAGLNFDEVYSLLLEWNQTNALPRWSEAEILHKVRSAFNRKGKP
jgi:hypothetical protein